MSKPLKKVHVFMTGYCKLRISMIFLFVSQFVLKKCAKNYDWPVIIVIDLPWRCPLFLKRSSDFYVMNVLRLQCFIWKPYSFSIKEFAQYVVSLLSAVLYDYKTTLATALFTVYILYCLALYWNIDWLVGWLIGICLPW